MRQWINLFESQSMILYHGTPESFDKFDINKVVSTGPYGRGIHFSNDYNVAKIYSRDEEPLKANVTLKNPYTIKRSGDTEYDEVSNYIQQAKIFSPGFTARERLMAMGYDGVILNEGEIVVVYDTSAINIIGRGK